MTQTNILDRFLLAITFVYLAAFTSIYIQIPGLYGDHGILPVRLSVNTASFNSFEQFFSTQASLVRLAPRLGLSYAECLELVALTGCLLSALASLWRPARNPAMYFALWLLYQSVFKVGQTFMWFQWDILLLEVGFLCVGLSIKLAGSRPLAAGLRTFAVKWLLFRLMYASGVVKLTSGCPTWWGLEALDWHYESQCIPTPFAWYAHQLPGWFQRLCVAATLVIEIGGPFLFFVPTRAARKFSFYSQLLLQVLIIITGNYNFFNLLTIVLCLSLLNDDDLGQRRSSKYLLGSRKLEFFVSTLSIFGLLAYSASAFSLSLGPGFRVNTKIAFNMDGLQQFNRQCLNVSVYIGVACLLYEMAAAFVGVLSKESKRWLLGLVEVCLVSLFVLSIFTVSLVPHSATDEKFRSSLPHSLRRMHGKVANMEIVNSYGLFRRMTGVGGRPEVVLQAAQSPAGPWRDYEFRYKPGDPSRRPPFAAPHQPRLDWQMWFAALGDYKHNPWLLNLVHRLLQAEPSVLQLLQSDPFNGRRPKFVRALLYKYRYSSPGRSSDWWRRKLEAEYLPPVEPGTQGLAQYLQQAGIDEAAEAELELKEAERSSGLLRRIVRSVRLAVGQPEGLGAVGCVLVATAATAFMLPA